MLVHAYPPFRSSDFHKIPHFHSNLHNAGHLQYLLQFNLIGCYSHRTLCHISFFMVSQSVEPYFSWCQHVFLGCVKNDEDTTEIP